MYFLLNPEAIHFSSFVFVYSFIFQRICPWVCIKLLFIFIINNTYSAPCARHNANALCNISFGLLAICISSEETEALRLINLSKITQDLNPSVSDFRLILLSKTLYHLYIYNIKNKFCYHKSHWLPLWICSPTPVFIAITNYTSKKLSEKTSTWTLEDCCAFEEVLLKDLSCPVCPSVSLGRVDRCTWSLPVWALGLALRFVKVHLLTEF